MVERVRHQTKVTVLAAYKSEIFELCKADEDYAPFSILNIFNEF
jgi:hypothetical protein